MLDNPAYTKIKKNPKQITMSENPVYGNIIENSCSQSYVLPDSPAYANVNVGQQAMFEMSENPSYVSSRTYSDQSTVHVNPAYLPINGLVTLDCK